MLESKRPLIVMEADESCTVNKKLGVCDSKYVLILHPPLTGTWYRACALPILRLD